MQGRRFLTLITAAAAALIAVSPAFASDAALAAQTEIAAPLVQEGAAPAVKSQEPAAPKQKFYSLAKVRQFQGTTYSRNTKPAAARANMAVIGDGKYFPLPRGHKTATSFLPQPRKNLAADTTKSLPQSQAQHILSLFSPDELE